MGSILLFDKSALQSFGINESVWLDNFFLTNITPLFYIETLADLYHPKPFKPPQEIISELGAKTPSAQPNVHHSRLVLGNLLGIPVEMDHGRPIIEGGKAKKSPEGKYSLEYAESQETKALRRWQMGEYQEVEEEMAKSWRTLLDLINFEMGIEFVKNIIPDGTDISSLENIHIFIQEFLKKDTKEVLIFALEMLGIPEKDKTHIISRWEKSGKIAFNEFAPYAAYVLSVDLLFYIAAMKGIISKDKKSNKIDLAYLYYLPFCHVFTSGDNLHKKTVPLFLRPDQSFVEAREFKQGLTDIDNYFSKFEAEIAEVGVMKFVPYPPVEIETTIHSLWDKHTPGWRDRATIPRIGTLPKSNPERDQALLDEFKKKMKNSIPVDRSEIPNSDEADSLIIARRVPVKRGKWRILPKGIENKKI